MSQIEQVKELPSILGIKLSPENFLKLAALLLSLGAILNRISDLDERVKRLESFMDSHVVIISPKNP